MPDNEKPVNATWHVGIAGQPEPLTVRAAYLHQPPSTVQGAAQPVVLKDADHKIVFHGAPEHVQYVRRADCTSSLPPVTPLGAVSSSLATYRTGNLGAAGVTLTRIRCHGCRLDVPVECGDVTGMGLDGMIAAATQQAAAECPAHDVIKVSNGS